MDNNLTCKTKNFALWLVKALEN